MSELSPITYHDATQKIRLSCYADTFVYHKASGKERNLVAMRFGGYPEHVRGMADALCKNAGVEAVIENHTIILQAKHKKYKRFVTHDGIYAEGMMQALDDENSDMQDDEQVEVENPKQKRKMYIYCNEGDTDSLYAELDKKTSIPLIPEFKDYVLEECLKRKILVQLEVLSASVYFDAYMLEMRLVGCSKKVIGMTATLINGYSSGMFYLLYRIVPYLMKVDNKSYDAPNEFNSEYGVTETTYELQEGNYNANSRSSKKLLHTRQKPGVSPLVYSRFLIDCAVFLSLNDMGKHLPDYEEIPVELELRSDIKEEYDRIEAAYRTVMMQRDGTAMKLMSRFLSLLTTYPDQPYDNEPIYYPKSDIPAVEPKSLSNINELNEKDIFTLSKVEEKVKNGERVMIFTSWVKIDTQDKLKKLLEEKGYRVAVLEQRVSPEKREEWVEKRVENGLDVLITNPSLVETGLDLNAFTTLIFYNIGYNLFTFRQASRRSWRINQTAPRIEVYILCFKGVMQARAIRLMASKLAAATLVEGNFSDEGLAAMSDCSDMTSQLARELTKGIRDEVEDVSAMFKKMAIIKDADDPEEDLSEYVITDEPEQTICSEPSVISIADKIKKAMYFAQKAKEVKKHTQVKHVAYDYNFADRQLSLFDILDEAG